MSSSKETSDRRYSVRQGLHSFSIDIMTTMRNREIFEPPVHIFPLLELSKEIMLHENRV